MFANGWALAIGGVAIALPVIIHWLTRPRPTRIAVSTLRFIRGAVEQRRNRYRLRNFLILLLRTIAIALLATAIARPLLHRKTTAASVGAATVTRIVLLDCSQSMGARDGGIIRFERARPVVSNLVRFQPLLKCNLLLAAATPNPVVDAPTTNSGILREALEAAIVRPERLRLQLALNLAADMFAQSDEDSELEFVIISDFQRANWATADFSILPEKCRIELKSMAATEEAANMAVLGFAAQGRVEAGREAEVAVRVGNYSDTPRHVRVEVHLGSSVVPFEGHCAARATSTVGGRIPISSEGWLFGSARLVDTEDALPEDDRLAIGLHVHPQPRITIVTRDRTDQVPSAAYYVERALTATFIRQSASGTSGNSGGGSSVVNRLDAVDPDVELLRQSDIVVLARPGRLSSDTITVLSAMLQRGHSMLYVAGDQLDAANLNDLTRTLGTTAQLPVYFLPRPSDRSHTTRFLTEVDRKRPPFSIFGDELTAAVKSLEFTDGLISRAAESGLKDDIRATLNDQSAFLTVTSVGRARLAVMNADLERSNIARTPVLVPLLGELVSQELTTTESNGPTFSCGEPFTLQLAAGEERLDDLQILGPENSELADEDRGTFTAIPAGIIWNMSRPTLPGAYQVKLEGLTLNAALAAIPNEESDLRSLTEEVFAGRLSGGRALTYASGTVSAGDQQDDTWVWLAAACVGCILLELMALRMFMT